MMSKTEIIVVNSGILFLSRIAIAVLSFFVSVFIARHLGAEGYGTFSIVFAYLSFFQILTGLGIDIIVIREISKDVSKQNVLIGNGIVLKVLFSVFAIIASGATVQFMGYTNDVRQYVYIASLGMLFSFSSLYVALFQAHYKLAYYAIPELIVNVIFSGIILLLTKLHASIIHYIILQTVTIIPLTVIYLLYSSRIADFRKTFKIDLAIWKLLISEAWPIFFSAVFISINTRIDQIMVYNMLNDKSLGLYSALVRLVESLSIIPMLFAVPLFPLLCSSLVESSTTFTKIYNISFKYMSIIIIPISAIITFWSQDVIQLIYGADYIQGSPALSILMWSEVFVFLGTINANVLNASGMQKYGFILTGLAALTNIVLNFILIPAYGIVGASIATVVSYGGLSLLLQYLIMETRPVAVGYMKSTIKPLVSSIPILFCKYQFSSFNIFLLIPVCVLLYITLLVFSKALDQDDLNYARQIVSYAKRKLNGERIITGI